MRCMLKPNSGSTSAVVSDNEGCLVSTGVLSVYDASGDGSVAQDEEVHESRLVGLVGATGIRSLRRVVFLNLLVQVFSLECLSDWSSMSSEMAVDDWDILFVL